MRIAIRFEGAHGPVAFECTQRDYPASFEVPPLVRKHARRLGAPPAGALEPVAFLNYEVGRAEDLLAVNAGDAKVVCAKLRDGGGPPVAPGGGVLLGTPMVAPEPPRRQGCQEQQRRPPVGAAGVLVLLGDLGVLAV